MSKCSYLRKINLSGLCFSGSGDSKNYENVGETEQCYHKEKESQGNDHKEKKCEEEHHSTKLCYGGGKTLFVYKLIEENNI